MKKVFLIATFFIGASALAGGTVGNGGDSIPSELASVEQIQGALNNSPLLIRLWLNSVDRRMNPGLFEFQQSEANLAVPKGAGKLFLDDKAIFNSLGNLNIIFKKNSSCTMSGDGKHDGSAVSTEPFTICISGFSLSKKLTQLDFRVQTEALILHEISHLMGADEDEAVSVQNAYLKEMQFISTESLPKIFERTSSRLRSLGETHFPSIIKRRSSESACKAVDSAKEAFNLLPLDSDIPQIEFFNVRDRDSLENYYAYISQVLHRFICGQLPGNEAQLIAYKKAFRGKPDIDIREWLRNMFAGGIWKIPDSQVKMNISMYKNSLDIKRDIDQISKQLIFNAYSNAAVSVLKPAVVIIDYK